jgi:hypothetical protein
MIDVSIQQERSKGRFRYSGPSVCIGRLENVEDGRVDQLVSSLERSAPGHERLERVEKAIGFQLPVSAFREVDVFEAHIEDLIFVRVSSASKTVSGRIHAELDGWVLLRGHVATAAIDDAASGGIEADHLQTLFERLDINGEFGCEVFEGFPLQLEL